jgi:hypothetical protein
MRMSRIAQARAVARAKAIALGVPPSAFFARPRRLIGRPSDHTLALMLVAISATGSLGAITLWIAGHGHVGLQVLSGAILLILGLLLL